MLLFNIAMYTCRNNLLIVEHNPDVTISEDNIEQQQIQRTDNSLNLQSIPRSSNHNCKNKGDTGQSR